MHLRAFCLVLLSAPVAIFAIAPGEATDVNTSDYSFVGQLNGASAVLVGPDMVLTAKHVGTGTFTLPGIGSFTMVAGSAVNHPTDDLTLFRINASLSNYALVNVDTVLAGTSVTMVGFGGSGTLNGSGTGYNTNIGGGVRRKANGIVEGTVFIDEPGFRAGDSLYAPLRTNGQGALVGGDSGGGWFVDYNGRASIVGTNSWIGTFGTGVDNFQFSNDPNNFFASGAIELSKYSSWLTSNGVQVVPEPASMIALAMGGLALLRRRKK